MTIIWVHGRDRKSGRKVEMAFAARPRKGQDLLAVVQDAYDLDGFEVESVAGQRLRGRAVLVSVKWKR